MPTHLLETLVSDEMVNTAVSRASGWASFDTAVSRVGGGASFDAKTSLRQAIECHVCRPRV